MKGAGLPLARTDRRGDPVSDVVLWRRLTAEFLGSAFLAALVIGSGIAAQRLSPGDTGLELLENAAATAAGLYTIILMFGPVSGGHFNPVVSFADAAFGGMRWRDAAAYLPAQVTGCSVGAVAANLMFSLPAVSISAKHRASSAHFLSEIIATFGLILVIFALTRTGRSQSAPAAVGAYIGAAYFFTSSASFANPAITIGRMFSDTFAGIAPSSAPAFVGAQAIGGLLAVGIIRVVYPGISPAEAADIVLPHPDGDLEATGMTPRLDTTARQVDVPGRKTYLPLGTVRGKPSRSAPRPGATR
jgi:glycerol uptake facilitator-like aquaporin